jgi:hypothetical protein
VTILVYVLVCFLLGSLSVIIGHEAYLRGWKKGYDQGVDDTKTFRLWRIPKHINCRCTTLPDIDDIKAQGGK